MTASEDRFRPPFPQSFMMPDRQLPKRRSRGETPEELGRSIDKLFEGIEGVEEFGRVEDIVLGGADRPKVPSFPDSARDADLLDDVEIRPVEVANLPDSREMLKALEEEILREAAERNRGNVDIIPLGASVTGGLDEIPIEEWSLEEAKQKLAEEVRTYLAGDDSERSAPYRRVGQLAWRLQEWSQFDPVASAVERLALGASKDDQDPLELARRLLTPPIARTMTNRLSAAARDVQRRSALVETISRLGVEMASALGDALTESTERVERRAFIDALVALGDDALPTVEDMTFDDRWFVVRNAMLVLREIAGDRAIGHYTAALGHTDPRVRKEALLALAHVGGENAAMLVTGKIADVDAEVRQAAAMAAGALKATRALKPLLEQLDDEQDLSAQAAIILALGQIGDPGAVHVIEKRAVGTLLKKPPPELRVAAYRALGAIGTPHARKLLKDAATDKDQKVRDTAIRAMAELESRTPVER